MITRSGVRTALLALLLAGVAGLLGQVGELHAQERRPVSLMLIEEWLRAHVPSTRIQVYVAELGTDFELDDAVAIRLREQGASEELIVTLRAVSRRTPVEVIRGGATAPAAFRREELKPIYYGGRRAVGTHLDAGFLSWRGDGASFTLAREERPTLSVAAPRLPESPLFYGSTLTRAGGLGVDLLLHLHDPEYTAVMLGPTFEPFFPVGVSGYRLIAGGAAWLSYSRFGLTGAFQGSPPVAVEGIRYTNLGAAGAARLGLAYHYRPGLWIYAESQYRRLATLRRALRVPDGAGGTENVARGEIPWPKLGSGGVALRLGLGWDFGRPPS